MNKVRSIFVALTLLVFTSVAWANPLNINTASVDELAASISGVGPGKAAAIVAYREQHGPFGSVEDLTRVKGIGVKTIEAHRDILAVE